MTIVHKGNPHVHSGYTSENDTLFFIYESLFGNIECVSYFY